MQRAPWLSPRNSLSQCWPGSALGMDSTHMRLSLVLLGAGGICKESHRSGVRRSPPPGATPGGGGGLRPSPAQHNQLCCQLQARPSLRSVQQRRLPQHKAASPPLIAPSAAPEALNGPAAVHSVFKQPVDERRRVLSLQPFKHGYSGDGARCGCNKAVSSVRLVCPGSAGPGECASLHGRRAGGPLG